MLSSVRIHLQNIFALFKSRYALNLVGLGALLFVLFLVIPLPADAKTVCGLKVAMSCRFVNGIAVLMEFVARMFWALSGVAARFMNWVLIDFYAAVGFVKNSFVQAGWAAVRDISNWFFIVFFLIAAISTILNLQRYNARQILPKLIVMAILVNFSLFITGFVINVANMFMYMFAVAAAGPSGDLSSVLTNAMGTIKAQFPQGIADAELTNESGDLLTGVVLAAARASFALISIIFALSAIFIFGFIAFLLITRVIYLWISMILSPLAFVLSIFPKTEPFFQKWSKRFIDQAIFGVLAAFFLWLSTYLAKYLSDTFQGHTSLGFDEGEVGTSFLSVLLESSEWLLAFVTIWMFLYMAMKISKEMSGEAGAAVFKGMKAVMMGVGLAGGMAAGGAAIGAIGKGVTAGAARTGLTGKLGNAANRIGLGRVGERFYGAQQRAYAKRTEKQDSRNLGELSSEQFRKAAEADAKHSDKSVAGKGVVSDRSAAYVREAIRRGEDFEELGYKPQRVKEAMRKLDKLGHGKEVAGARLDLAAEAGILTSQKDAKRAGETITNEDAARQEARKMSGQDFAKMQSATINLDPNAPNSIKAAIVEGFKEGLHSGDLSGRQLGALARKAQDDKGAEKTVSAFNEHVLGTMTSHELHDSGKKYIEDSPIGTQFYRRPQEPRTAPIPTPTPRPKTAEETKADMDAGYL